MKAYGMKLLICVALLNFWSAHEAAAYYDPEVGRYLTRDPAGYADGLNPYLYVHNNPVNHIDPLGLYAGADDLGAAAAGAVFGFGGQLASDLFRSAAHGKLQMSSWQDYTASTAGGAAGGEAFLYSGPVGAGAVYGATANATRQGLNLATGNQKNVSLTSFAAETGLGAVAGGVVPQIGKAVGVAVEGTESLVNQAANRIGNRSATLAVNDLVEGGVNKVTTETGVGLESRGLRPLSGTRQIPEGIPESWRIRLTDSEGGALYYDPAVKYKANAVRVMPGDPTSPFVNSQAPYVRWQRHGQAMDINGNVLPTAKIGDAHIPLQDFQFNPDLFK